MRRPDFYDRAVAYFREHSEEIAEAWDCPGGHHFGDLFGYLARHRHGSYCGCPSQVRSETAVAETRELTERVRGMRSIPTTTPDGPPKITTANLPAFARAQRLADELLGRPEPQEETA